MKLILLKGIYENHTFVANNFADQLNYFKNGCEHFENNSYINSVQFNNNKIIRETMERGLFEPIYIEFPYQEEVCYKKK